MILNLFLFLVLFCFEMILNLRCGYSLKNSYVLVFHCWDKIPGTYSLKQERFTLALSFNPWSAGSSAEASWWQGVMRKAACLMASRKQNRREKRHTLQRRLCLRTSMYGVKLSVYESLQDTFCYTITSSLIEITTKWEMLLIPPINRHSLNVLRNTEISLQFGKVI